MTKGEPIRLMIFPHSAPEFLLIKASGKFSLPQLSVPFDNAAVHGALEAAGVVHRITDGHAGRWTDSIVALRKATGAERAQRAKEREIARLGLVKSEDRVEITRCKMETDEELRQIKEKIGRAKLALRDRGEYMPAEKYRDLERRLEEGKRLSQAFQVKLGEIKRRELAEAESEAQRFMDAAYSVLTEAQIESVLLAMDDAAVVKP